MKISLLTDAPKHNLALMKLATYHEQNGDEVKLNMPLWKADYTYASVLFEKNKNKFIADEYGGPAYAQRSIILYRKNMEKDRKKKQLVLDKTLAKNVESCFPNYSLYNNNHFGLGFTFRPCFRKCTFCKVSIMNHPDIKHHSIWEFHDSQFKKICLLNNNTFMDKQWKETFEEIWDASLIVKDENGYDLRLIDEEKATVLKKTKWDHGPKFAWDLIKDEKEIFRGLNEINKVGFRRCTIYVLIGFNTTLEEDIYRCQKIHDMGHNPFPMIYENNKSKPFHHKFRRMIYARYYRKDGNIRKAWNEYKR